MNLDEKIKLHKGAERKISVSYILIMCLLILLVFLAGSGLWYNEYCHAFEHRKQDISQLISQRSDSFSNIVDLMNSEVIFTRNWLENYIKGHKGSDLEYEFVKIGQTGYSLVDPQASDHDISHYGQGLYGRGKIDTLDSHAKDELNMAVELYKLIGSKGNIFDKYFSWSLYCSENDFFSFYGMPGLNKILDKKLDDNRLWLVLRFMRDRHCWRDVLPKNDPHREIVWNKIDSGKDLGLIISISAPVYDGDRFMGVLIMRLSSSVLGKYTRNLDYNDGNVIIANQYENVICSTQYNDWEHKDIRPLRQELGQAAFTALRNAGDKPIIEVGNDYIFVKHINGTNWRFIYRVPARSIRQYLIGTNELYLLIIGVVTIILIAIIIGCLLELRIVSPLFKMIGYVRKLLCGMSVSLPKVPKNWRVLFDDLSDLPCLDNMTRDMDGILFQIQANGGKLQPETFVCSQSLVNFLGVSPIEITKLGYEPFIDEAYLPVLEETVARAYHTNEKFNFEFGLITRSGDKKMVRCFGYPRMGSAGQFIIEGHFHSIDEICGLNYKLSIQKRMSDLLADVSFEGMMVHDGENIVLANDKAAEILGFDHAQDIIGQPIHNIVSAEAYPVLKEKISEGFTGYYEMMARHKSGARMPVEIHVKQLRQDDGHALRIVALRSNNSKRITDVVLQRRDRILQAVTVIADRVLRETDIKTCLEHCMPALGEATNVSQVTVLQVVSDAVPHAERIYYWAATKIHEAKIIANKMPTLPLDKEPLTQWVRILKKGHIVFGNTADLPDERRRFMESRGIVSSAIIPIIVKEKLWGTLCFLDCENQQNWATAELDAMKTAGDLLASAIEREMALYEINNAKQREANIGSLIQDRLLRSPVPEKVQGLDIQIVSLPSMQIDGDFFDFFQYDSEHFDLILGDVMGKGVSAALLGAAAKTQFLRSVGNLICTSSLTLLPTPEEIVNLVHESMCSELINLDSFITACYARVDMFKMRLDYVDCGHTKVIHYRARKGKCEMLSGDNFPLGFSEQEHYIQHSTSLEAGDILVFYSDGLVESTSPSGELFGHQRIIDFLTDNSQIDCKTMAKKLYERLITFSMSVAFRDDMTYLILKIGSTDKVPLLSSDKIIVKSRLESLKEVRDFIKECSEEYPQLDANFMTQLLTAVNESTTNIIGHGYLKQADRDIEVQLDVLRDRVIVRLRYWGRGFSNELVSSPAFDGSQERGFGLFMSRQCVDEMTYSDEGDGSKIIKLVKFIRNE